MKRGTEDVRLPSSGHKNIVRVDHPAKNQFGWFVRVQFSGQRRSKFFADAAFESKQKALDAAIAFRSECETDLGRPRTDRSISSRTARNTSGIVGVRRAVKRDVRADGTENVREYYEASWSPRPRKLVRKFFSISELGERRARLAACRWRREREREAFGKPITANWAESVTSIIS